MNKKAQKSIISLTRVWKCYKEVRHLVLCGLTKKNWVAHKEKTLNSAQRETTQTTLVDNSDFLQSGNAVLSFYTNKLIYLSTLYLKSYVHLLFYITVYIIKNLMKTYLQINES